MTTLPLLSPQSTQIKLAQVQHCYITTMWKQNDFIQLTATQFGENKTSAGPPSMDEEWLDEKQAGEEMTV